MTFDEELEKLVTKYEVQGVPASDLCEAMTLMIEDLLTLPADEDEDEDVKGGEGD